MSSIPPPHAENIIIYEFLASLDDELRETLDDVLGDGDDPVDPVRLERLQDAMDDFHAFVTARQDQRMARAQETSSESAEEQEGTR